ncbi:hypothetical protein ZIOFF_018903 [Zingiber officinale]|uniref:C2H2-type domain-containing protein n=2 Tax=Zingiber officinale TaxID=94328 RepID=A0A8J5HQX9_ZINOF|nr:hypothetical protein ZIOFF_018903 [Zingiber officinale]
MEIMEMEIMETPDEAASDPADIATALVKGKRTRRQRLPTPAADSSASSAASASIVDVVTEEDEDVANCLILLAHGPAFEVCPKRTPSAAAPNKFTSKRLAEATSAADGGRAGYCVYECKTCGKCFSSFQALGGHRTSHKKPKSTPALEKSTAEEEAAAAADHHMLRMGVNNYAFAKPKAPVKVHECAICGTEFSSGQALGGHMRRHRPLPPTGDVKKEKSFINLSLDLNLPAPEDEMQRPQVPPATTSFSYAAGKGPLVLPGTAPASALAVDCHY